MTIDKQSNDETPCPTRIIKHYKILPQRAGFLLKLCLFFRFLLSPHSPLTTVSQTTSIMTSTPMPDSSMESELSRHLVLVNLQENPNEKTRKHLEEEIRTAPLFSSLAREIIETQHQQAGGNSEDNDSDDNGSEDSDSENDSVDEDSIKGNDSREHRVYPQYGLLGLRTQGTDPQNSKNNLVYANISAPWSSFICGSQGSGKSHTLSCILENALIPSSPAGRLSSPLAGLIVHYDKFTAYGSTQLCEAAYLCSSGIPVRVLVSPTNYIAMKQAYERLPGLGNASGLLKIVPMYLSQKHLNISVIKTLMGVGAGRHQPLYVEVRGITIMKTPMK